MHANRRGEVVFVYGSLLPGLDNHHVIAPYIIETVPGVAAGRLVDCGEYPALIRGGAASGFAVRGLWMTVMPEALGPLDELEDFLGPEEPNDYDRIWVRDRTHGLQGWTYVWPETRGCPFIPDDYWPDYWNKKR